MNLELWKAFQFRDTGLDYWYNKVMKFEDITWELAIHREKSITED